MATIEEWSYGGTPPLKMEEPSHLTQRILHLTLEIIYLLTGENYVAFKLCNSVIAPSLRKMHSAIVEAPPLSLPPKGKTSKKVQDVTKEIIELLTGEEREASEGLCEVEEAAMMENQPPHTLQKWAPPTGFEDSAQEEDFVQEHLDKEMNVIEIKEEECYTEEEVCPHISPDSVGSIENRSIFEAVEEEDRPVKTERKEKEEVPVRGEEEISAQICPDEQWRRSNKEELHFLISADCKIEVDVTAKTSLSPSHPQTEDHSSDPSRLIQGESNRDPPHLVPRPGDHKKFPCSKCGRCFNRRSKLLSHKRCHLQEEPYLCSICGKGFALEDDLLEHFQTHTGDRPFLCSYCRKPFPAKSCVERHELIHTGQRPFSCSVCGICFSQKANLTRHQRTHTGEKPFSCPQCGKSFTRKATMVEHWQLHK